MDVQIYSLEEMETVIGAAADTARRLAVGSVTAAEFNEEYALYSLKIPFCVTVWIARGCCALIVKDEDRAALQKDLLRDGEVLANLFTGEFARDGEAMTECERTLSKVEENLIKNRRSNNTSRELIRYRKSLLAVKKRAESAREVIALKDAHVSEEDKEDLLRRAERLIEDCKTLRDYLGEVRDAYQSAVQVGQNRIMQTFTVIAAIFMPLQLITGWFGMNLIMPEFTLTWVYPVVVGACAVLVAVLLFLFKRRHWL